MIPFGIRITCDPEVIYTASPLACLMSWLYFLAAVVFFTMAAKRGRRRRRMGRYIRGEIDEGFGLSTLASRTLLGADFDNTVSERTLVSSIVASYSLEGLVSVADDGPIAVYISHSDYTDAERQAVIDATQSWDEGDLIGQEVAKRKMRHIGTFKKVVDASGVAALVLNDGKPIKTKLNWILTTGMTLNVSAFNLGSDALTTGATLFVQGHANLWPR